MEAANARNRISCAASVSPCLGSLPSKKAFCCSCQNIGRNDQQTDRDGEKVQEEFACVADCLMRRVDVKHDKSLSEYTQAHSTMAAGGQLLT